jgi:hypothetical protein
MKELEKKSESKEKKKEKKNKRIFSELFSFFWTRNENSPTNSFLFFGPGMKTVQPIENE